MDQPNWLRTKRKIEKAHIMVQPLHHIEGVHDMRFEILVGERVEMMAGDRLIVIDKFAPALQSAPSGHLFELWFVAEGEKFP